jgi:hypothetical protein
MSHAFRDDRDVTGIHEATLSACIDLSGMREVIFTTRITVS